MFPDSIFLSGQEYIKRPAPAEHYRVAWDDESPQWGYKSRTLTEAYPASYNPPAVWRFYPEPINKMGEFYANLAVPYDWKQAIIDLNGSYQDWEYLTKGDPGTATYNKGWPKQSYLVFSGNRLQGEFVGEWYRFETLKPSDLSKVRGMTIETHPHFIQRFTCVTWAKDAAGNWYTKHIESTGAPRGQVYQYLVSNEGIGYIPKSNVVKE